MATTKRKTQKVESVVVRRTQPSREALQSFANAVVAWANRSIEEQAAKASSEKANQQQH